MSRYMRGIIVLALLTLLGCGTLPRHPSQTAGSDAMRQEHSAQEMFWRIRGSILDMETREPLIGANAIVRYRLPGSDSIRVAGAATNVDGRYVVRIPSPSPPQLVDIAFSYIGYESLVTDIPQFPMPVRPSGSETAEPSGSSSRNTPPHPLLIDRGRTTLKAVVTQEEIRNLPVR